jgi:hypothetical protein
MIRVVPASRNSLIAPERLSAGYRARDGNVAQSRRRGDARSAQFPIDPLFANQRLLERSLHL